MPNPKIMKDNPRIILRLLKSVPSSSLFSIFCFKYIPLRLNKYKAPRERQMKTNKYFKIKNRSGKKSM